MESIIFTESGDTLVVEDSFHVNDESKLSSVSYIGYHKVSKGFIYLYPASDTFNRLLCKSLLISIPVPVEIDTYGKLRKWFANRI